MGFACIRGAGFKPFWRLALVRQARAAIFLAALRRFRGAAFWRGLRPSSLQGASFWPSGLTLRSSGPAFCGPLAFAVLRKNRFSQPHVYPNGISLHRRYSVLRLPFLRASPGVLRRFAVFLASRAFTESAGSYQFESIAPPH